MLSALQIILAIYIARRVEAKEKVILIQNYPQGHMKIKLHN